MSCSAARLDQGDKSIRIISLVRHYMTCLRQCFDQPWRHLDVSTLPGRERDMERQSLCVGYDMDFGTQSATRAADGFFFRAPFFAPAECWWARTMELSISASDCGIFSDRA